MLSRNNVATLRKTIGETVTTRSDIEEVCKEFCTDLFASKTSAKKLALRPQEEKLPSVTFSKVRHAVMATSDNEAPGKGGNGDQAATGCWSCTMERACRNVQSLHGGRECSG